MNNPTHPGPTRHQQPADGHPSARHLAETAIDPRWQLGGALSSSGSGEPRPPRTRALRPAVVSRPWLTRPASDPSHRLGYRTRCLVGTSKTAPPTHGWELASFGRAHLAAGRVVSEPRGRLQTIRPGQAPGSSSRACPRRREEGRS